MDTPSNTRQFGAPQVGTSSVVPWVMSNQTDRSWIPVAILLLAFITLVVVNLATGVQS